MKVFFSKLAYATVVLIAAGYAFVALRGPNGIPGMLNKRHQVQEMENRNAALAREIEEKRARVERLRDSQSAQDQEIRQRLKLVKPDEKVFILQDPVPKPAPKPPLK
jgi:cell division protein FtsB